MISEIFRLGPIVITPYGLFFATSILLAGLFLSRNLRRYGVGTEEDASAITLAAGIGGVLGAKVYYALLYGDLSLLWSLSGLVWYGGFLGGAVLVLWVLARRRIPMARGLDVIAPSLALGYGVGRIGCFLVGDDYGSPTELPWGVAFPVGLPPTTAGNLHAHFGFDIPAPVLPTELVEVHPTQLYETVISLTIALLGVLWLRLALRPGLVATWVVILLAAERFSIEFLRAKDDRFFGRITLAQVISLAVIALAVGAWWLFVRRRDPPAGADRLAARG